MWIIFPEERWKTMIVSRENMIAFLREAADLGISGLFFGEPEPLPESPIRIHKMPRILMPLSGEKRIRFAGNGRRYDRIFTPGEVLVTHPSGWTEELWDRGHRMISIVFFEDYIRVIYIAHNGLPPAPNGPDIFFHTKYPLSAEGRQTLGALLAANRDHRAVRFNFQALLTLVLETLENQSSYLSRREMEWGRLLEVLQANFRSDIVREDIAGMAKLHPARLSRLLRERKNRTLREYMTDLRLEHALDLLRQENLSIDAVASHCGFNYTNYFIRVFRKRYGDSPAEFRKRLAGGGASLTAHLFPGKTPGE